MFKDDIHEESKNAKYNDLEDMVYRFQLTYDEIIVILDLKHIPTKRTGYSLNPGIYEVVDINNTFKCILQDNVKVTVTIGDIRLKSNLKINQTSIFTNKNFVYTTLGFTQLHSYPLDDLEGFYQLTAWSCNSEKPTNITGTDKVHLKCDCIDGSIVSGAREPILYLFGLSSPPGHYIHNQLKIKLFKKPNRSVLSHVTFDLEDDDHKPADFNNKTVSFTCQLIKIKHSCLYNRLQQIFTNRIVTIQGYTYKYMSFSWTFKWYDLKMKQKISYYQLLKTVKRFLNRLTEKQKKHLKLKTWNQEKYFISVHLFILKEIGW